MLTRWFRALLREPPKLPSGAAPLAAAEREGLLPWMAHRLTEADLTGTLPPDQRDLLARVLRRQNALHLDCEGELARLAAAAEAVALDFILMKGHAVARTLYPDPACRPTTDFDLWIDPNCLDRARSWLRELGYRPLQPFVGDLWLASQSWARRGDGPSRFTVDLHWDCSNRMYFRRRLPFHSVLEQSGRIDVDGRGVRVPGPTDAFVIACVHRAALPLRQAELLWLLDIVLLLRSMGPRELARLLPRAELGRAVEACVRCTEDAAGLTGDEAAKAAREALRPVAKAARWRSYQRTLRWRWWDLLAYWARLPLPDKLRLVADGWRWLRRRRGTVP